MFHVGSSVLRNPLKGQTCEYCKVGLFNEKGEICVSYFYFLIDKYLPLSSKCTAKFSNLKTSIKKCLPIILLFLFVAGNHKMMRPPLPSKKKKTKQNQFCFEEEKHAAIIVCIEFIKH